MSYNTTTMRIQGIALQNVRGHQSLMVQFRTPTTVVTGANASGKTTLIEALALLSTGESFRAQKIEELINFDAELGRIKAIVGDLKDSESGKDEIEVLLTRGEVQGKRTAKRIFSVNDIRRRKKDAIGKFYAVVFMPEDMRLIEGSPGRRRSFLDTPLAALHPRYDHALRQYEQVLRRRNKLLPQVRDGEQSTSALQFWNLSLLKHGQEIQNHRRQFLQTFREVSFPLDFLIDYQPSVISESRLDQYLEREIAAGHTLIGPHKDDFVVTLSLAGTHRNVALYGSRGQQRLAVLWLKYCELQYAHAELEEKPLLLLDDILSELDDDSKVLALEAANNYQTVITTTQSEIAREIKAHLPGAEIFTFKDGKLI